MTEAEKALLLAFIDNSISQMQALRGAVGVLCRSPVAVVSADRSAERPAKDIGDVYSDLLNKLTHGNDDGEESTPV